LGWVYVDLLDWLIGPVEKIQAMTGTLARKIARPQNVSGKDLEPKKPEFTVRK